MFFPLSATSPLADWRVFELCLFVYNCSMNVLNFFTPVFLFIPFSHLCFFFCNISLQFVRSSFSASHFVPNKDAAKKGKGKDRRRKDLSLSRPRQWQHTITRTLRQGEKRSRKWRQKSERSWTGATPDRTKWKGTFFSSLCKSRPLRRRRQRRSSKLVCLYAFLCVKEIGCLRKWINK